MKASSSDQPQATGETSSFTSRHDANGKSTHFATVATKAKPKPAGKALLAGAAGFVAILIIGVTSSSKGELGLFTVLMAVTFGAGLSWILQRTRLNDERTAAVDTHFSAGHWGINTVSPQAAKIPPEAIDLLRIRRTMTGTSLILREFIGAPSVGSAVALAGAGARNQLEKSEAVYLEHLAANSFVVEVESHDKTIVLAGGLDESTATRLMNAVAHAVAQP